MAVGGGLGVDGAAQIQPLDDRGGTEIEDLRDLFGQRLVAYLPRAEAAGEAAQEDAASDIQYVLYIGTNDKDTNKPVYIREEAVEKVKDILMAHFGGYTIQSAYGGWVSDEGTKYQEYTIVVYLSDTTLDAVHAAADELITVFNQSSILIQANPTRTEFYSGQN